MSVDKGYKEASLVEDFGEIEHWIDVAGSGKSAVVKPTKETEVKEMAAKKKKKVAPAKKLKMIESPTKKLKRIESPAKKKARKVSRGQICLFIVFYLKGRG